MLLEYDVYAGPSDLFLASCDLELWPTDPTVDYYVPLSRRPVHCATWHRNRFHRRSCWQFWWRTNSDPRTSKLVGLNAIFWKRINQFPCNLAQVVYGTRAWNDHLFGSEEVKGRGRSKRTRDRTDGGVIIDSYYLLIRDSVIHRTWRHGYPVSLPWRPLHNGRILHQTVRYIDQTVVIWRPVARLSQHSVTRAISA